jgi:3-deoxy-manno-octulosonate cytidylyltransferase (CMP-KDO synthetase)
MKVSGIIPARYKSSRFPGKPLVKIAGKPLVLHVAEKAAAALGKENIFIATEDERIEKEVMNAGYNAVMTSDNIQGDEPMVDPQDIINVMKAKQQFQDAVINGMCLLNENENAENINIPKVVVNSRNDLIYMSRLAVPGIKSGNLKPRYLKQVCIYAFNFDELKQFGSMKNKAEFEMFEDIEILRFLELGIPVKMVFTSGNTLAVDVPDDVSKVEAALKSAHV